MNVTKKALTIAGSDSGGGAGIQADIKTFQELGVYGMSAITAVTAQNTKGVQAVYPLSPEDVGTQLDSIADDLNPDAVKTGMLFGKEIIEEVAGKIRRYGWTNLVVDPVMIAKDGSPLLRQEALRALVTHLIPLAAIITPNIPEAEALTGKTVRTAGDKKEAAKMLLDMGARYVLIKGGHDTASASSDDLLFDGTAFIELTGRRIETPHTHGTGCTLSAAIAAEMAKGKSVPEAVRVAKEFIQEAIGNPLAIGNGRGPVNHWAYRRKLLAAGGV